MELSSHSAEGFYGQRFGPHVLVTFQDGVIISCFFVDSTTVNLVPPSSKVYYCRPGMAPVTKFLKGPLSTDILYMIYGSGFTYASGYLSIKWHEGMTQQEGIQLSLECIQIVLAKDGICGGEIRLSIITEDGVEHKLFDNKDICTPLSKDQKTWLNGAILRECLKKEEDDDEDNEFD